MPSCSVWTSVVVYSVCLFLFLLAFVTPWWKDQGGDSKGLWMRCTKPHYVSWQCTGLSNQGPRFKTTQAMMCLALIGYIILLIMYVICLRNERLNMRMISYCGGITVLFTVLALIIFGAVIYHEASGLLSWSFTMACVSCVLLAFNSVGTYFVT